MHDECLLELHSYLIPESRAVFEALSVIGEGTMEDIMLQQRLKTQSTRKGTWGLRSTGLIDYSLGRPVRLSANGQRLVKLLEARDGQQ